MPDDPRAPDEPASALDQETAESRRRALVHLADLRELEERAREMADRAARGLPEAAPELSREAPPTQ